MNTQTNNTENTYLNAALEFADKYDLKLKVGLPKYGRHFTVDTVSRYIFPCTLSRNGVKFFFKFGQSIASGSEVPNMYDVLACLQKSDVGSYEEFCGEFGYEAYNYNTGNKLRSTVTLYNAVCKEYESLLSLFDGNIPEELYEIS